MRLKTIRLVLAVSIAMAFSLDTSASEPKVKLTKDEKKIIDHLVKNWGEDYDVTSVDVAMESLKMKPSDSTRVRVGTYIKQNPELHEVIRQWGWVTIVLNANEKLIARMLINAQRDGQPTPSVTEIAKAVFIPEDQVKQGLAMLRCYEIVQRDKGVQSSGYGVAPRYLKWEPRLDFIFHTVTLADGRKFSVN